MSKTSTNLAMALVFLTMGACGEKMDYLTTEHRPPDNNVKLEIDLMRHEVHQSVPNLRGQLPNINLNQIDWDGDGFLPSDGDCDNFNPDVGPGFFDFCDGLDNDCDGEVDEDLICATTECDSDDDCIPFITECIDSICLEGRCFTYLRDDDGDGWSRCGIDGREPPDCNENNPLVNPGTAEICDDDLDNDCDAAIDEDGCIPLPTEICDGLDNDYDGETDEDLLNLGPCVKIFNGVPTQGQLACTDYPDGASITCQLDCQYTETCGDGLDNDCDGIVDDAYPPPSCTTDDDCSCFDHECSYFRCIEGQCLAYGRDDDGDGALACGDNADCDDADPTIYPGAPEYCDGIDSDCDGEIDEESCEQGVCTMFYECSGTVGMECVVWYECVRTMTTIATATITRTDTDITITAAGTDTATTATEDKISAPCHCPRFIGGNQMSFRA